MAKYNHAIEKLKMPPRIRSLPIDDRGYPVPKFVAWPNGKPDFRCVEGKFLVKAVKNNLCWLCGQPMGKFMVFVIGPMCAINRTSSEPPSHYDCASFAVRACPFLVNPQRKRNEHGLPEEGELPGGIMIKRNPGVSLLWVTQSYKKFPHNGAVLFRIGEPHQTEWFAKGRKATREEIMASIESGLPLLRQIAEQEGSEAVIQLDQQIAKGLELVPAV